MGIPHASHAFPRLSEIMPLPYSPADGSSKGHKRR
jgi:hypothetical protein